MTTGRAHWSNRLSFILAAAGSAIGLGNLWRFPYMTGQNGGGAFVLVYLACIFLVGLPVLIAELYIGQHGQKNAVDAFEATHRKKTPWRHAGSLGVVGSFLILTFYSVVGGWVLDFEFRSMANQFGGHSESEIKSLLGGLFQDPWRQLFWHGIFCGLCVAIVVGGLKNGIEKWNRILMPALFVLLALLFIRALFLPGFLKSLAFIFSPDFSKLNPTSILEAVGQSFFTLSLGMGCMITYGSYLSKKENLVKTAFNVAAMDTMIALIAGVVIFSIVFSFNLEPGSGPTLMFQTLPVLFSKLTGGYLIGVAFFLLVSFAALTSAVSLFEVVVAYFVERRRKDRQKVALAVGFAVYLAGFLSALSTNALSDFKLMGFTFFDLFDKVTSSVMLPVGGLLIALFYGWVLGQKAVDATAGKKSRFVAMGLMWTSRVVAPLAVIAVLLNKLSNW